MYFEENLSEIDFDRMTCEECGQDYDFYDGCDCQDEDKAKCEKIQEWGYHNPL